MLSVQERKAIPTVNLFGLPSIRYKDPPSWGMQVEGHCARGLEPCIPGPFSLC